MGRARVRVRLKVRLRRRVGHRVRHTVRRMVGRRAGRRVRRVLGLALRPGWGSPISSLYLPYISAWEWPPVRIAASNMWWYRLPG